MKHLLLIFFAFGVTAMGSAQCYEDRHNTSWNEGWQSCEPSENPYSARGLSHWVMYDFGHTYRLGNAKVWNINAPELLDNGFRDFYIDYSPDGLRWKELGQFTLDRADGTSIYEGLDISSFGGDTARFVVLTALNNWGGDCSGLAEVKFDVVEVVSELYVDDRSHCFEVAVYPNPHREFVNVSIRPICPGDVNYQIYDHAGKMLMSGALNDGESASVKRIDTRQLAPGLYHLVVTQRAQIQRYPLMKI